MTHKTFSHFSAALFFSLLTLSTKAAPALTGPSDLSFRHEVLLAIDRGLDWLQTNQNTNGYWSTPDQPALTALALNAFMGEPAGTNQMHPSPAVQRGYDFILRQAKPDGSIYAKGLQNYNTSICLMALVAARNDRYTPLLQRGRRWILTQQIPAVPGEKNSVTAGGVGYGDHGPTSDMNNTLTALEALYYTKYVTADRRSGGGQDLDWKAAIHFIQSCQNLPGTNQQAWVSDDIRDRGGFVYAPGSSKAGSTTNAQSRVALRSYGSISYAGLLSYIYADLPRQDPRIEAALAWVTNNYTLDENPGMGQQGFYYYLHLMTKALTIDGDSRLHVATGAEIDWRRDLAMKLINLQKSNGAWANENGRWLEHDPSLVTAYSLMSLEMLYPQL